MALAHRRITPHEHTPEQIRRIVAGPLNDANPNTAGKVPGNDGTYTLPEWIGDDKNPVKGYTFAFDHPDAAIRITVTPWLWSPRRSRWRSMTGITSAEPDKLYGDLTIGVGTFYFQLVETSAVTINASNVVLVEVAPR